MTTFYASRAKAIRLLLVLIVAVPLSCGFVFDGDESIFMRMFAAVVLVACGGYALAALPRLLRRDPALVITAEGFTALPHPPVAWADVTHVQVRNRAVRGHETPYLEVVRRDPHEPIHLSPDALPVSLPAVVDAMRRYRPDLIVLPQEGSVAAADLSAFDVIESALVHEATRNLPAGWTFAVLWFVMVGEEGAAGIQLMRADESVDNIAPSEKLLTMLNEYKHVSYDERTGTFLSGQLATKPDTYRVQLSHNDIPDWVPVPAPEEFRREFAGYPRPADRIPDWIRDYIG